MFKQELDFPQVELFVRSRAERAVAKREKSFEKI
jgi:hypothetical protein